MADAKKTSTHDEDIDHVLITKEGLKKLQIELEELKTVKRQQVSERLKEAISYGDLSENSEYEEAKNEQAFIEGRILELEQQIKNAKIITSTQGTTDKTIQIGSSFEVKNVTANTQESYTLVGSTEADPFDNKISNESPVGKALIGLSKGSKVDVKTPNGMIAYEVIKIA